MSKPISFPPFDAFPQRTLMPLRFGDTDQQGHVNNAVFATAYETGRVAFLYDPERAMPPAGTLFVIAQLNIAFLGEMRFPGDIVIGTGVRRIGTSSVTMIQALQWNGEITSTAESIIVLTDPKTRRSTPLPDETKALFESIRIGE